MAEIVEEHFPDNICNTAATTKNNEGNFITHYCSRQAHDTNDHICKCGLIWQAIDVRESSWS